MMVEKLSDTAVPLQLKTNHRQAVDALGRLEQHGAAIRARLLAVERGDEGLVEQIREPDSLWYRDARNPRLVNYPG